MPVVQPLMIGNRVYRYYRGPASTSSCPICGAAATPALKVWLRRGWANRLYLALARKRIHKGEGRTNCMPRAEEGARKLAVLPDRVAAVVGKTYAVMGDEAQMADDQALMMIRDLLEDLDPTVIERNKNKRLNRR
jgi:hypothetical protein